MSLMNVDDMRRTPGGRIPEEEIRHLIACSIDQASEGIVWLDADGHIVYANDAACRRLGYSREELMGLTAFDIDPAVTPENWLEKWAVLLKDGALVFETKHRTKAGVLLPVEMSIKLIEYNEREFCFCICGDIPLRSRLEEEKASLQPQFQQARKLESVGRLAGGVAHDLNSLLAPILGHSEMLLDDFGKNDLRRESALRILEAGLRARDIVRQLLAFSRKQTMEIRPVSLHDLLTRFQKLLRRTLRKDIRIEIISEPGLPQVQGDIGQLEQMVMNLAVNAQDAMPCGGLLSIETAVVTLDDENLTDGLDLQQGTYALLTISDTGHGMDEEIKAHIFDPFFSTKAEPGSGLGLATVYGIVKQHGGDIRLQSESGVGTTFNIYLPVSEDVSTAEQKQEPVETLQGFETILLVEQSEQVRSMTADLLSRRGYHVLQAENGGRALELLQDRAADVHLLLTDIVMPGMDGSELFEKAAGVQPDIHVLYMSGLPDDEMALRNKIGTEINFILKPFTIRGLTTKVREVLDGG